MQGGGIDPASEALLIDTSNTWFNNHKVTFLDIFIKWEYHRIFMDETMLQRKCQRILDNMSGKWLCVVSAVTLQVNKQADWIMARAIVLAEAPSAMLPISAKHNGISWV